MEISVFRSPAKVLVWFQKSIKYIYAFSFHSAIKVVQSGQLSPALGQDIL